MPITGRQAADLTLFPYCSSSLNKCVLRAFDDTGGSGLLDGGPPSIEEALSLSMSPGRAFHHTHWLNAGTCLECVAHPQEVAQDKAWGCQPSPTPGSTGTGTGGGAGPVGRSGSGARPTHCPQAAAVPDKAWWQQTIESVDETWLCQPSSPGPTHHPQAAAVPDKAWWQATTIESVDDDALTIILAMVPAAEARAAFCVSKRWSRLGDKARQARLKLYWRALFRSDVGFPDWSSALLTATDCFRFEARLLNSRATSAWRCLSCLQHKSQRLGDFCSDCVGDEEAFVQGNGGYVMCNVTCGHPSKLVYWCALCEASACRYCLMGGACTFCLLLSPDAPACLPYEP